ncbi:MAG: hypothetical protein ACM3MI_03835 [Clostridiales bacterium]
MCITPQEEISRIMKENGLSYNWIAEKMGTYYQKVQYALELQKEMPLSTYNQIMQLFEKHGYIKNSLDACNNLISMTFRTNAKFGNEIRKLNDQISEDISDSKFSPDERLRLRIKLEDIKKEFNAEIDALIALTENK